MIYFISGHRNITQEEFNEYYKPIIADTFLRDTNPSFVLAECEGADSMAQDYLKKLLESEVLYKEFAPTVTVYHMYESPRYLASSKFETKGGYTSDVERDTAMTKNSNIDIAFIKDSSRDSGTRQNIIRRHIMN